MPANRLAEGLVAGLTVTQYVALAERKQPFLVNWVQAGQTATARIKQFNIKGAPVSPVEALSGGNQQRTLLGLLPPNLRLLLMEQPTRAGLDMVSIEYIWGLLQERNVLVGMATASPRPIWTSAAGPQRSSAGLFWWPRVACRARSILARPRWSSWARR